MIAHLLMTCFIEYRIMETKSLVAYVFICFALWEVFVFSLWTDSCKL